MESVRLGTGDKVENLIGAALTHTTDAKNNPYKNLKEKLERIPRSWRFPMLVPRLATLVAVVAVSSGVEAKTGNMISLRDSLEALASRFNEQQDRPRVVAILSPT